MVIVISANTSWYLYNFRASTIRRLSSDGHHLICLSPSDGYGEKLRSELGCEWIPLHMDNQGSNPLKDMAVFWQFIKIYRRFKPKVVMHFTIKNNAYGTWAARLLGIPAINNVSGLGTAFIHKGFVPMLVRLLYRTSFPFAFRVFCQNEEDYQLLINKNLVPANTLRQLPGSGVDINRFSPSLRKPNTDAFRFVYAGRMLADKGLRELHQAMQGLLAKGFECELWLVGFTDVQNKTAIGQDEIDTWCETTAIKFLGSSDTMELILADVDCIVLPSYREGMPRSLLEAGAMGLPSVATDVPGCRNIIEHNFNGLLCDARSVESLKTAMESMLLMSGEERNQLGVNARSRVVEQYSEDKVVELTMAAINDAIS